MYEHVNTALKEVIKELQIYNGNSGSIIHDGTCPATDIPNYDSLIAVEVSIYVSVRVGFDVKPEIIMKTDNGRPLTIGEISQLICKTMSEA